MTRSHCQVSSVADKLHQSGWGRLLTRGVTKRTQRVVGFLPCAIPAGSGPPHKASTMADLTPNVAIHVAHIYPFDNLLQFVESRQPHYRPLSAAEFDELLDLDKRFGVHCAEHGFAVPPQSKANALAPNSSIPLFYLPSCKLTYAAGLSAAEALCGDPSPPQYWLFPTVEWKQAIEVMRRTEARRVESLYTVFPSDQDPTANADAPAAAGGVTPTSTKPTHIRRRGRRKADFDTIQREAQIADEWEQAREAHILKADFAVAKGMQVKVLDALLDRVDKRKRASE